MRQPAARPRAKGGALKSRRLLAVTTGPSSPSRTLSYQYDPAGNRTRVTWPETGANALYVSYVYDVLNRVTQIEENGATSGPGLLASYAYDGLGRPRRSPARGDRGRSRAMAMTPPAGCRRSPRAWPASAAATYTLGYNAANQIVTRQVSNDSYTAHPGADHGGLLGQWPQPIYVGDRGDGADDGGGRGPDL